MEDNPYQSPAANIGGQQSINTGDGVSAQTVELLARTRPWTLFVAVLGFVAVAFMVLAAIIMLASASQMGGAAPAGIMAVFYFAIAAIYALPLIRLIQYSSAITQLRIAPNTSTLEVAMDKQRSFWKTIGIMMLIGLILGIVMVILLVSFASRAAASGGFL